MAPAGADATAERCLCHAVALAVGVHDQVAVGDEDYRVPRFLAGIHLQHVTRATILDSNANEAGVLESGSQLVARWDAPVVEPVGEHDLARGHRRHNDADAVERLPDRAATVDNRRPDAGLDRRQELFARIHWLIGGSMTWPDDGANGSPPNLMTLLNLSRHVVRRPSHPA